MSITSTDRNYVLVIGSRGENAPVSDLGRLIDGHSTQIIHFNDPGTAPIMAGALKDRLLCVLVELAPTPEQNGVLIESIRRLVGTAVTVVAFDGEIDPGQSSRLLPKALAGKVPVFPFASCAQQVAALIKPKDL